jgi:hypothetical protein
VRELENALTRAYFMSGGAPSATDLAPPQGAPPANRAAFEADEARRILDSAAWFGRPVVATEALGRPNHGELHEILPLFEDNGIGWYLWELMIGADQARYQWPHSPAADGVVFQGLLYPDGTPYAAGEIELIRSLS